MQEWTEYELRWYLETLAENDTFQLATALFSVARLNVKAPPVPTGNAKVITHLEQLVKDQRWCVVDPRPSVTEGVVMGEMRWLAAQLLACEYAYQGIETPITLDNLVLPIKQGEIARIMQPNPMPIEKLIEQKLLPTKTEIIKPQDYAYCCSKEAVAARRKNQNKNE